MEDSGTFPRLPGVSQFLTACPQMDKTIRLPVYNFFEFAVSEDPYSYVVCNKTFRFKLFYPFGGEAVGPGKAPKASEWMGLCGGTPSQKIAPK